MGVRAVCLSVAAVAMLATAGVPEVAFAGGKPSHAKSKAGAKSKGGPAAKGKGKGGKSKGGKASKASAHGRKAKPARDRHGRLIKIVARAPSPPKPQLYVSDGPTSYASCANAPPVYIAAAAKNAATLDTLSWSPFGAGENGWQIYEAALGREIGTECGGGTPVFAEKLAAFQARFALPNDGVFGGDTFAVFKGLSQQRRPFVMMRVAGLCPDAPPAEALSPVLLAEESFERPDRYLRTDALEAYRAMVAAARAEDVDIRNDPKALTIFSGFRSPESDAQRCVTDGNCDGTHRAACSAHRTGTAVDLNVGWITRESADSTGLENRKWQVRSPAYKWLLKNAGRFGFVNYAYEPWHWEYIRGSAPLPSAVTAEASGTPTQQK